MFKHHVYTRSQKENALEALTWKLKNTSLSIQNNQANYVQNMYMQRNIRW
jgi:hypothetical protein